MIEEAKRRRGERSEQICTNVVSFFNTWGGDRIQEIQMTGVVLVKFIY